MPARQYADGVIPVLTPEEMRAADAAALSGVADADTFIRRAGHAVARVARQMMNGAYGRRVLLVAGPGNNGNDGRVAAGWLREWGALVEECAADDPVVRFVTADGYDLVIDAAFGIGFRGEWSAPVVVDVPVLAVDIPSGLDALTGEVRSRVLPADRTVTFAAVKTGMVLGDGPSVCGEIDVVDVGIDPVGPVHAHIVDAHDVAAWLPPRVRDAHKWDHAVRVVSGSPGMGGAAALVSAAAMRAGAGIVHLSWRAGEPLSPPTEVVGRPLPAAGWSSFLSADHARFGSLVIGPGLGRGDDVESEVRTVLGSVPLPAVVDGDGLIAAVDRVGGYSCLVGRSAPTVLTPHDGEFTALGGAALSHDRIGATRDLARATGCVVLRKGPTTIISDADGSVYLVVSGDERLATAGSGDVLAGIIGAFLARGVAPHEAAAAAAYVHGAAGSSCPAEGTIARDVVAALSDVLTEVTGRVG